MVASSLDVYTGAEDWAMTRVTRDEYEEMLNQAGDAAEDEADQNLLDETIAQRLAALAEDGQEISEAEQAAATAEAPPTRPDGVRFFNTSVNPSSDLNGLSPI